MGVEAGAGEAAYEQIIAELAQSPKLRSRALHGLTRIALSKARGEEEAVVCYEAATGEQVWVTSVPALFEERTGDGPRATPEFRDLAIKYGMKPVCVDLEKPIWEAMKYLMKVTLLNITDQKI